MYYFSVFGRRLKTTNPQSFNEKLIWLKLNRRDPLLTNLVDKYAVKKVVADLIGEEYVVKNYGAWNSFDEIDFNKLPNQFVLKVTHDSSGAFVCRDKNIFDFKKVRKEIDSYLTIDYYKVSREWPYKNVPRKVIADEFLDDHTGNELRDYKFWCFDGKPTYMYCSVKANSSSNRRT